MKDWLDFTMRRLGGASHLVNGLYMVIPLLYIRMCIYMEYPHLYMYIRIYIYIYEIIGVMYGLQTTDPIRGAPCAMTTAMGFSLGFLWE